LYWAGPFPDFNGVCFAIGGGISLALMQAFLANAFLHGETSKIGIFQYVSIVFVGIFDWIFWRVVPPAYTFLGVVLVVIAGIIIIRTNKLTIPSELE
jgi:drug/metabolite transporter (DMT)-like permease